MRNFKTPILLGLFFILMVLMSYHWISPENGDYEYRAINGRGLLTWTGPFYPCVIEYEVGEKEISYEGNTPIFGTDNKGSDSAYRISEALWTNIWLAFIAALVFIIFAIIGGVLIGYDQSHHSGAPSIKNGNYFEYIRRLRKVKLGQLFAKLLVETLHAIPMLLLLLVVVIVANGLFEDDLIRMLVVMVAIGILSIPKLALLIRDRIYVLEDEEFINAAKASGLSDIKIIITHILWYECSPIIAGQFIYVIVQAIMLEAVISFLGYGVGIDYSTLGGLIKQFQGNFPGTIGGTPLALLPLIVLLLVAVVGNGFTNLFMKLRHE